MTDQSKTAAIIVAAGRGERMGGVDKIFAPLGGKPILARTIGIFQQCPEVGQIVAVLAAENVERCQQMIAEEDLSKVACVCTGGARRQDSVKAGLEKIENCDWVIVHDGARPLVTVELIRQGLAEAIGTGAAVAAVPVTDTIKVADDDRIVQGTPPRGILWAVQTPQVFRHDILARAYSRIDGEVTDDASLVERLGHKVKLYMGSYDNIKITNRDDLALAEVLFKKHGK